MSYLDPSQQDQQNQSQQNNPAPAGNNSQAPSSSGSLGSVMGGVAAPSYSAAAPTSGTQNTGFQNLSNYLDANQNNTLSSQVAGNIQGQANQANQDLQSAQSNFKNQVDQNTVNTNQGLDQSVTSDPLNASAADTAAFQSQLNANYGGPTSANNFQGYQQATTEGQNAYNAAQAVKNEGGIGSTLDQYFGNPNYSQGQKALDTALFMGGDQTALNNTESNVQNMPAQFQQTGQQLNDYANKGAASTQAANEAARNALGVDASGNPLRQTGTDAYGNPIYSGAIGNIQNAVQTQVGQDLANAGPNTLAVQNALSNRNLSGLTPNELSSLGDLSSFNGKLYGVDPSQFVSQNTNANYTNGTVITPQQQAQLDALYKLANTQDTFSGNPSLAGTAAASPFNFDSQGFQSALNQNSGTAQANLSNLQSQIAQVGQDLSGPQIAENAGQIPGLVKQYQDLVGQYNAALQQAGPIYNFANGQTTNPILMGNTPPSYKDPYQAPAMQIGGRTYGNVNGY